LSKSGFSGWFLEIDCGSLSLFLSESGFSGLEDFQDGFWRLIVGVYDLFV
jgi:hypothetical protein